MWIEIFSGFAPSEDDKGKVTASEIQRERCYQQLSHDINAFGRSTNNFSVSCLETFDPIRKGLAITAIVSYETGLR